ncbi:MAG: GDP-mannose 4,6-dehydratase [Thermoleophilaceae bacterium]
MVTGGAGFAGSHLVSLLGERGAEIAAPAHADLDLLDADAVARRVAELRPAAVHHLAALASVGRSWQRPRDALRQNLEMTLNVLEAARAEAPDAVIVLASSGEVYGPPATLPVSEDAQLRPQNPYAVSKAACDLLARQYADAHGLRVAVMRSFNHAGPRQSEEYVVGSFARQVAEAQLAGNSELVLHTGDVESSRDFTDVRDVVRAYAEAGALEPGVYNVCSGVATRISTLIELLGEAAGIELTYEVDPERLRAADVPEVRGSAEKLHERTGWEPEIPLSETLADAVAAWRAQLAR